MAIAVLVHVHKDPGVREASKLVDDDIQAFLYDISEFGLGLLSSNPLPWGTLVEMEFPRSALPLVPSPGSGQIHVAGRVVHSIPSGAQYRVGVSFTRMEELDRDLIRRLSSPGRTAQAQPQDERRRAVRLTILDAPSSSQ